MYIDKETFERSLSHLKEYSLQEIDQLIEDITMMRYFTNVRSKKWPPNVTDFLNNLIEVKGVYYKVPKALMHGGYVMYCHEDFQGELLTQFVSDILDDMDFTEGRFNMFFKETAGM